MPLLDEKNDYYSAEDYYALPEGEHVELINGKFYDMASPSQLHQEISSELFATIHAYIRSEKGQCKVFTAPFDVKLETKRDTIVQPDISVICDSNKLDGKKCNGAPDWIIEIVSPSSSSNDYVRKYEIYKQAGVREYWLVHPDDKSIVVHRFFGENIGTDAYTFDDAVRAGIYDDLTIDFKTIIDAIKGNN